MITYNAKGRTQDTERTNEKIITGDGRTAPGKTVKEARGSMEEMVKRISGKKKKKK